MAGLLNPLLDGMRAAGAEVELYYSADLIIFPCCGNLNCTVRTPGRCMACDDMIWLRSKIGQADALVLASPLYYNGKTGRESATESMRLLEERLFSDTGVSGSEPYEHAVHTTRESVSLSKVVIVSGSGFWEVAGFNPVLTHLKALCHNTFPELAGCITGPMEAMLRGELPEGLSESEVARIARRTGRDMVTRYLQAATAQPAIDHSLPERTRARTSGPGWREWDAVVLYQF